MADDSTPPVQRVSTSLETLRTEIRLANAELELRIIDRVASKAAVEQLARQVEKNTARIDALDEDKAGRDAVRDMGRYFVGGGILTTIIMICQLALTFWLTTRGG